MLSATIALGWWLVLLVVLRRGNLDSGAWEPDLKAVRFASACTAACAVTGSAAGRACQSMCSGCLVVFLCCVTSHSTTPMSLRC